MSKVSRRKFNAAVAGGAVTGLFLAGRQAVAESDVDSTHGWPAGFLWGAATASHQIEGNNVSSDYWLLEHLETSNFVEPSGDACDSWNRWRDDIAMIKSLGLNSYRFSVELARIEPEQGYFSAAAIDVYRAMCLFCRCTVAGLCALEFDG